MNRTQIKSAASKLGNALYYACPALYGADGFDVRSLRNGAKLGWLPTLKAAERRVVRMGLHRLRLGKTMAGLARENQAILEWL